MIDLFDSCVLLNYLKNLSEQDKINIQQKSYTHPNGFIKIILRKNDDGSYFRLHYWINNYEDVNFHNHGWNFKSKIINGVLKNMNYSKHLLNMSNEINSNETYFEYVLNLTGNNNKINADNSKDKYILIKETEEIYDKNCTYYQEANIIHKAVSLSNDTITIIKQEPLSRTQCEVYSLNKIDINTHYDYISLDELNKIIDHVINIINNDVNIDN